VYEVGEADGARYLAMEARKNNCRISILPY
jgi:hypothetical protein